MEKQFAGRKVLCAAAGLVVAVWPCARKWRPCLTLTAVVLAGVGVEAAIQNLDPIQAAPTPVVSAEVVVARSGVLGAPNAAVSPVGMNCPALARPATPTNAPISRPVPVNSGGLVSATPATTIVMTPTASRLYEFDTSVGSEAPPDTLGGYPVTAFGPDPSPLYGDVTSLMNPCPVPDSINFSAPLNHRRIGSGWMTWSHGYTGDVYYTDGALSVTIMLPAASCAFYFYVEPNPFEVHSFTVTADDGSSTSFTAFGSAGAVYCGILGAGLRSVTVSSDVDFAVGEFALACVCGPVPRACCYEAVLPAYCEEDVDMLECIASGGRWDVDVLLCTDLDPPCGEYGGACCYGPIPDPGFEPYQCIGDMLQADCLYLSEYTNWTGGASCGDPDFLCPGALTYCDASGGCGGYIQHVVMPGEGPGIDNTSGCDGYADYTTMWTLVVSGVDYPITVAGGTAHPADVCSIWVDWNQDKTFEDYGPELIGDQFGGGVSPPYNFTLTVPDEFTPGYTRMRIRIDYANPDPDPCGTTSYGEVEDYSLFIGDGERGACCNSYDASCFDDYPPLDCVDLGAGWYWYYLQRCSELGPPCGDPGACCDHLTGGCIDGVLRANCVALGRQAFSGQRCGELNPPCGDPGCCCDRPEPGVITDPHFAFRANCSGRFIAGAFTLCGDLDMNGITDMSDYNMFLDAFGVCIGDPGFMAAADLDGNGCVTLVDFQMWRNCYLYQGTDCTPEAFAPECGMWNPVGVLYAPSNADNSTFRDALSALLGARVDFWDSYSQGTPSFEQMREYAAVMTWANYPYADAVAMGNNLADYVDDGGRAILGQWCRHSDQGNYLQGRVTDDPAYCPVLTCSTSFGSGLYMGDGTQCATADVTTLTTSYLDVVTGLQSGAQWDGHIATSYAAVWRPDMMVWYSPGNMGGTYEDGDWAILTYNEVICQNTPGACCNVTDGVCIDDLYPLDCITQGPDWRWHPPTCAALIQPCGDPGCCCDPPEPGVITDPHFAYRANCDGRFLSGVEGADCVAEAWPTECGLWVNHSVLYAPSWNDNPGFRAALAAMLGGATVDYWNAYTQGTPPLSTMESYAAVMTWVNYPYGDAVGMGNTLADYVDASGRVILGQWCRGSDASHHLTGRIMDDPTYCPVLAVSTSFGSGSYNMDGIMCPHYGPFGEVGAHDTQYLDVISSVADTAFTDGTIDGSISAVWTPDALIWYAPGFTGTDYGGGDWVRKIGNMIECGIPAFGACCNILTGECLDHIGIPECLDYGPTWRAHYAVHCVGLVPPCGDPGACCDIYSGECVDDVLATVCNQQHHSGWLCAELDPPCGDPGCCCDFPESGVPTDPHFDYAANCSGRFISGLLGADCVAQAFDPACGLQQIAVVLLGPAPPPPDLCGLPMTPFAPDTRPLHQDVTTLPTPCTVPGAIAFDPALNHRRIGSGWASWSHAYRGDVYYSNGVTSVTMTMPIGSEELYFYVEPNPFAIHTFTVLVNGTYLSDPFTANGSAGAAYVGVCGNPVETILLTCTSGADFAVGEFGMACLDPTGACCAEWEGVCTDDTLASDCVAIPHYRFVPNGTCDGMSPECGTIQGACCYETDCVYQRPVECEAGGGVYAGDFVPCDPNPCLCADYYIDAPGTYTGTTCGMGDDCALRTGVEVIFAVSIPWDGLWTFSLCGSDWDTYWFFGNDCCTSYWSQDDSPECGVAGYTEQEMTAGTYFIDLESYSSGVCGDYHLEITGPPPPIPGACCDDYTGDCIDDVIGVDCHGTRHAAGGTCDELSPECGISGACCDDYTGECVDGVFQLLCTGRFAQTRCADLVPVCGIRGACCDDTAPEPECVDGVLEVYCADLRFAAGMLCADLEPPCEIPVPCADGFLGAPGSWSGTTCGGGNDCALRSSEDIIVGVSIPTSGNWRLDLCSSSPAWNTCLYLGSDCCASTWFNDDGCATTWALSVIECPDLPAGTYYATIEAYGTACGPFTLQVDTYEPEDRDAAPERAAPHRLGQLQPQTE